MTLWRLWVWCVETEYRIGWWCLDRLNAITEHVASWWERRYIGEDDV